MLIYLYIYIYIYMLLPADEYEGEFEGHDAVFVTLGSTIKKVTQVYVVCVYICVCMYVCVCVYILERVCI